MVLLRLVDRYSAVRLEAACEKALSYTAAPSYKSIKNILAVRQDKPVTEEPKLKTTRNKYGITRDTAYYRR